jgi:hypothetical protein
MTFEHRRKKFSTFYSVMQRQHEIAAYPHRGYGLDHDVMVAEIGAMLTDDSKLKELVWLAGMVHSLDRIDPEPGFETHIRACLQFVNTDINLRRTKGPAISQTDLTQVFVAARDHSKLNDKNDGPVTVLLKDADRLAIACLSIAFRSGQTLTMIPTVEFEHLDVPNPRSTYRNPLSSLDNIRHCLEYEAMLRNRRAKKLGKTIFADLRWFVERLVAQHKQFGLDQITI